MGSEEFKEMVKATIENNITFLKEFIWQGITAYFEEENLSEEEIEYWLNGGDGDVIVDKIFEKMLDTVKDM